MIGPEFMGIMTATWVLTFVAVYILFRTTPPRA